MLTFALSEELFSYQCDKNLPMFNPRAGNETKSVIFLFREASKRFRCRHSTLGKLENVCCFFVDVFFPQTGHITGSLNFSGSMKCSRQVSTLSLLLCPGTVNPCDGVLLAFVLNVNEMFMKGSHCTLFPAQTSQTSTDRNVPSNRFCATFSSIGRRCRRVD